LCSVDTPDYYYPDSDSKRTSYRFGYQVWRTMGSINKAAIAFCI
jgi:hypothetical protein